MIKYLLAASLGVGEIILIVACAAILISAVITAIISKAKGKPSCGGYCDSCERCSHCKSFKSNDSETDANNK